jgi:peptide/nickel transport system permease protein
VTKYLIKRILMIIPVLLGVSLLVFVLMRVFSPDPGPIVLGPHATEAAAAAWRTAYGLDRPIVAQYWDFLTGAVRGDLGMSFYTKSPVTQEIMARFPATVELAFVSIIFASVFGIILGVISAVRKNSIIDAASTLIALIGVSIPIFWLGILYIMLFAGTLHWLPSGGRIAIQLEPVRVTGFYLIDTLLEGNLTAFWDAVRHLIMPAMTLGMYSMAIITRMTRATMLETLNADYIRTARAKGISEVKVIVKHALRNSMIPVTTVIGLQLGALLGGALLTESVFSWPGIGKFTVDSILKSDFPVVQGIVLLVAVVFVIMNLITDVSYAFLDPRIKYGSKKEG